MNGAKDNGLRVGVYHFFDWRVDPIEQANYFLTTAGGAAHVWNPDWANPWLDAETLDEGSITAADLLASMAVFCETVEAETHRIVGVYVSPSFWRDRLDNPVNWTRHPLWIADYGVTAPPNIGGWTGYTMWQWTSTADVDGVFPGPLDLSWYTPDPAWLPELV